MATDYQKARRLMVETQVRPNDVTDPRIHHALSDIPREIFLPSTLREEAYVEKEIVYGGERSLVTARDLAKLLSTAEIRRDDLILDVAYGAGYSTAILARLGAMVVAVDESEARSAKAEAQWADLGIVNAASIVADPKLGAPDEGLFNVIAMVFATEIIPDDLKAQLSPDGGRLIALMRDQSVTRGICIIRNGDAFAQNDYFDATASFVPAEFKVPKSFSF
ncbi:MAG: methyltransferase domain-containing protein [Pseudomonadota bacterium]